MRKDLFVKDYEGSSPKRFGIVINTNLWALPLNIYKFSGTLSVSILCI